MELIDAIWGKALRVVAVGSPHLVDVLVEAGIQLV